MIEMKGISKKFDQIQAVSKVSGEIREGSVFGLVGTHGAGKSTCLRMMSGILKADEGEVLVDGQDIYENEEMKREIFFILDDQYYFPNSTPKEMMEYYRMFYPCFDEKRFAELAKKFGLEMGRRINTFSKGMKKQVSVLLGVCANTKYLLCDETFDGLDPVMRQAVKSLMASEILNRNFTPVIASHNLREIDDICDRIVLLHSGSLVTNKETDELKNKMHKIHMAFNNPPDGDAFNHLDAQVLSQIGGYYVLMVKGDLDEVMEELKKLEPAFLEVMPSTLEEVFINEMEGVGYGK